MTIPNAVAELSFATNNTATPIPLTGVDGAMYFLSGSDLVVYYVDPTGAGVKWNYGSDYTIAGSGLTGSGVLTPIAANAVGGALKVSRATPLLQSAHYVELDGFPAATHEAVEDRNRLIDQDLRASISRAISVPRYEDPIAAIPNKAARANNVASYAADGSMEAVLSRGQIEAAIAAYLNSAIPAIATAAYAVSLAAAKALFAAPLVLTSGLAMTVAGRAAVYDGYQGTFIYHAADAASVFTSDGLGFVDNAGRRWKRVRPGFINAQWFGAKGDAVTDDYAALQAAFTTGVAQNQATVYAPRGTYLLSQTLNISNVGLMGDGAVATTFMAKQPFTGTELLLIDDTTGAGGGVNSNYRDFRIHGNRAVLTTVVAGMKLAGNALYLNFTNLRINECKGPGIVFDGKVGPIRRPTLNTWNNISISSGDSHGIEMKAGRHMDFTGLAVEAMGGKAIYLSGATEGLSKLGIHRPYIENITGDGIRIEEGDEIYITSPLVNGYGSTGVASYGYIITGVGGAARCKLIGGQFVKNAAPHANSRHIRVDAGDSFIFENLIVPTSELQFVGSRSIVINGSFNATAYSAAPLLFTNGRAAIAANLTRYLAPNTGGQDATQTNVRGLSTGYLCLAGLRAECTVLPGGAEQYQIALMVNGVATALTAVLTNANGGIDLSGAEVILVPGDSYSVRIISTVGAAAIPQDTLHITVGVKQ